MSSILDTRSVTPLITSKAVLSFRLITSPDESDLAKVN